jgi:membrane protease YdiL (CAAX protease family)
LRGHNGRIKTSPTVVATAPSSDPPTSTRRVPATAAVLALLAAATVLINLVLPAWAYPLAGLSVAAALLGVARWTGLRLRHVGLARRQLRRAAVFGLVGLAAIGLVFAVAAAVPALRGLFGDGRLETLGVGTLLWVTMIRIPLGTVVLEEIAFRGVLPALFGARERWRWRPALAAAGLFGLWHAFPSFALARYATTGTALGGVPIAVMVAGTMLAAGVGGILLQWWRHTGRGLLAPMLVHLATNSGGVLVAWWLLTHA